MERSDIPLAARVELEHAQIQAVARSHGVDALLVKGYAADPRLYVAGRVSSDVDVLVRPSHVARMVQALQRHDWDTVSTFRSGSIFRHAQTMRHLHWGLVDIHRSFPGFEMDPEELFEQLWAGRVTRQVAGYPCEVPGTLDHALLIVVHAARSPESLHQDVGHLAGTLAAQDWAALERRAEQLSASVAYAAATGQLPHYRDHPSHDLWLVLSQEGSRSQEWRARLRAATGAREKLRVALGAPLPNVDHLRMDLGREPTARDILRTTVRRPFQAVTELMSGRARRKSDLEAPVPVPVPARRTADAAGTMHGAGSHTCTGALQSPSPRAGASPADTPEPPVPVTPWLSAAPEQPLDAPAAGPPGALRVPEDVAWVDIEPQPPSVSGVCLARVPHGAPLVLNDSAALIWRTAQAVPEDDLTAAVASATDERPDTLEADVRGFTSDLVTAGFLERADPRGSRQPR